MPPARSARSAAFERIAEDAGHFPDLIPSPLDTEGLTPRDAALAHAIHDAAVRRWWTLQAVLSPLLSRPFLELETRLRSALLGGAVQLLLLDRIPPHAAISETVEWAKRTIRPGAGGLVNAVLRRVAGLVGEQRTYRARWAVGRDEIPLSDGRALVLAEEVLSENPLDRLSAASSIPRTLLTAWQQTHGADALTGLALHTLSPAPVIINTHHADGPVPDSEPHELDGFVRFTGDSPALGALLNSREDVWVQDPASADAVASVVDLSPSMVVDFCAGKGTKTRQLSAAFPRAQILATDTDRTRFGVLQRVFKDRSNVRVIPMDELLHAARGRADLVLLDVPCSNTGVLSRRPEAKYRFGPRQTERLTGTQRQIVADTRKLLSPGGAMLYSTCSLQPEENSEIARWASDRHRLGADRERITMPAGLPGDPPGHYHDASYSVLFRP